MRLLVAPRLLLLLLPPLLSGPLRAALGVPLPVALGLALLVAGGVALVYLRGRDASAQRWRPIDDLLILAPALVAALLLYNRHFGGLVAWIGSDGGLHIEKSRQFASTDPHAYSGFVAFYGVAHWLERAARISVFWSFSATFLVGAALLVALTLAVAHSATPATARRAYLALTLGATALGFSTSGLPLVHYLQLDGFLPHAFGLAPLFLIWWLDASPLRPWPRLLLVLGAVALLRYSYGLLLPDACLALAGVVLLDPPRDKRLDRAGAAIVVLGLVAAALLVHHRMTPLWPVYGWIIPLRPALAAGADLATGLGLLLAGATDPTRRRPLRFPALVVLLHAGTLLLLLRAHPAAPYYVQKYAFHGLVLGVAAAAVGLAAALTAPPPRKIAQAGALLLLGAGLWLSSRFAAPAWPSFAERAFGRPPFQHILPLADLGAWTRIEEELRRQHTGFGGYITSYGPLFNFMNAGLGHLGGGYFDHTGFRETPGYCVFFEKRADPLWQGWDPGKHDPVRQRLAVMPQVACRSYRASWRSDGTRTLCWVCR
jgi:hypothetical protein